jgi:hypothetical protein
MKNPEAPAVKREAEEDWDRAPRSKAGKWMWTLGYGHHEDRTPTHGYEATREPAMTAFAKSWRREA